ncbi:MAG TPA: 16S rRNA (cytosine(967)-C(5))-methyltransferase RsmB [Limnochordales bacterium]|nr:16S rRNA (cytosine(967)-C(5))-methyltransferase RsmB [Limnochordales bacterium]
MKKRAATGGPLASRQAAVDILTLIEERDAYAGLALDAQLVRRGLPPAARAYVTEVVYGVLRWRGTLDWMLGQCSHRPLAELAPAVRNLLRLAAYEVRFLDTVPAPVACHAAVELAKARHHRGVAAFVNGVCRELARRQAADDWPWPDMATDPVAALAVRTSHPPWLVARWIQRFGLEEARALCEANNAPPPLHLRVNILKATRAQVAARLREQGLQVEEGPWAPQALRVKGLGRVAEHPDFRSGLFTVQDEGAQLVSHALDPQPGERVIDLCAAPGGKTTHLAELMRDRGEVVAVDVHPRKLPLVARAAARLGINIISALAADGRALPGKLPPAHRVLVDAPCTGLGVLRRRPDLRWRKQPDELLPLAQLQGQLLAAAAQLVMPGGVIVYSTCSTEPEETTDVMRAFLSAHHDFVPAPLPLPQYVPAGQLGGWLYPHRHGTDGFFIARLHKINRKKGSEIEPAKK